MDECKALVKLINRNLPAIEAALREDPALLDKPLSQIDRLLSALGSSRLDYVLCAWTRQRRKDSTATLVQGELRIEVGVSRGYGMKNITNEYRSGMCTLDEVVQKIDLGRVRNGAFDVSCEAPGAIVLSAEPRMVFSQSVSLEKAFVELVLDEYRSFCGVVVAVTFRDAQDFYVVDASLPFSIKVKAPVFHCWKCLVNFQGEYAEAALYSGTHSAIPAVHGSVSTQCSTARTLRTPISIDLRMERRAFELGPLSLSLSVPEPRGPRKLLELRHFVARTDNSSLDYVMSDAQLVEMGRNGCLGRRASPLVRAHFGDFHRLFGQIRYEDTGPEGLGLGLEAKQGYEAGEDQRGKEHKKRPRMSERAQSCKKTPSID